MQRMYQAQILPMRTMGMAQSNAARQVGMPIRTRSHPVTGQQLFDAKQMAALGKGPDMPPRGMAQVLP